MPTKKRKSGKTVQRKQLVIVDGIVGGEGDGPLACDPVLSGTMIAWFSPVTVDAAATTVFDVEKIPPFHKVI